MLLLKLTVFNVWWCFSLMYIVSTTASHDLTQGWAETKETKITRNNLKWSKTVQFVAEWVRWFQHRRLTKLKLKMVEAAQRLLTVSWPPTQRRETKGRRETDVDPQALPGFLPTEPFSRWATAAPPWYSVVGAQTSRAVCLWRTRRQTARWKEAHSPQS